jgi:hypothetical protein
MSAGWKTAARLGLAFVIASGGGLLAASGATVRWHYIDHGQLPQPFALSPVDPTTTNVISFVAATDGKVYINDCMASVQNGRPTITVDSTNQIIAVTFSPVTNPSCPLVVVPVSGLDGQFGPLKAGTWQFNVLQSSYAFSVTEVPVALSIHRLNGSSWFQLAWPVSGDEYRLEASAALSAGNWQTVTNSPTIISNLNTIQLPNQPGDRFFRLRRY